MQKAHVVISPTFCPMGSTQTALCRAELKNFEYLAEIGPGDWNQTNAKAMINPITTCRICYQQEWPDGYLYLAKSGEEAEVTG